MGFFVEFTQRQFHRKYSSYLTLLWVWKLLIWLQSHLPRVNELTDWGQVMHICVSKLAIIGSDNGLLPGRCQAIIRTNAGILLIGPLGTNFSEIWIGIQIFSLKKIHLKMSSGRWQPFCLSLNELTTTSQPLTDFICSLFSWFAVTCYYIQDLKNLNISINVYVIITYTWMWDITNDHSICITSTIIYTPAYQNYHQMQC